MASSRVTPSASTPNEVAVQGVLRFPLLSIFNLRDIAKGREIAAAHNSADGHTRRNEGISSLQHSPHEACMFGRSYEKNKGLLQAHPEVPRF